MEQSVINPMDKKRKIMYFAIILLWIILNGRITGEILFFGIFLSVGVTLFATKVIGYSTKKDGLLLVNLPLFVEHIFVLIWEILKASLAVALLAVSRQKPEPVLIEFHSGLQTDLQNVLLANSITLTPGTITVFQEKDHFMVHCLRKEYGEGIETCIFVKLLGRIKTGAGKIEGAKE